VGTRTLGGVHGEFDRSGDGLSKQNRMEFGKTLVGNIISHRVSLQTF
jgi:hypothetical protein